MSDYYNANTPKFILGSAVDQGRLWWTVNNIAGDPFVGQHFNVSFSNSRRDTLVVDLSSTGHVPHRHRMR